MKINKIFKAKESFYPLYKKGDKFKIIKLNNDPDLTPIEALHLKSKEVYGFVESELEDEKK